MEIWRGFLWKDSCCAGGVEVGESKNERADYFSLHQ